jgi:hypothetical protein
MFGYISVTARSLLHEAVRVFQSQSFNATDVKDWYNSMKLINSRCHNVFARAAESQDSSTLCPSLKGQLSRLEQIFTNPKVKEINNSNSSVWIHQQHTTGCRYLSWGLDTPMQLRYYLPHSKFETLTYRSLATRKAEEHIRSISLWHLSENIQQFSWMSWLKIVPEKHIQLAHILVFCSVQYPCISTQAHLK